MKITNTAQFWLNTLGTLVYTKMQLFQTHVRHAQITGVGLVLNSKATPELLIGQRVERAGVNINMHLFQA
jgi:hypothetical protein